MPHGDEARAQADRQQSEGGEEDQEEVVAGLSVEGHGLYRSTNAGRTFVKLPTVEDAFLLAFGANAPGSPYPAVYTFGTIGGEEAVYRSDDVGASWLRISIDIPALGCSPNAMAADRQVCGRVYVGCNGRGIYYGQPVPAPVSATIRLFPIRRANNACPSALLILCAPECARSSRLR